MVEISLSGSGEGLGRAIVRSYSTIRGEVGNLNSIKFHRDALGRARYQRQPPLLAERHRD